MIRMIQQISANISDEIDVQTVFGNSSKQANTYI